MLAYRAKLISRILKKLNLTSSKLDFVIFWLIRLSHFSTSISSSSFFQFYFSFNFFSIHFCFSMPCLYHLNQSMTPTLFSSYRHKIYWYTFFLLVKLLCFFLSQHTISFKMFSPISWMKYTCKKFTIYSQNFGWAFINFGNSKSQKNFTRCWKTFHN